MRTVADEKGVTGEDVKACSLNQLHQSQGARASSGEHVWVLSKDTTWDHNGDPLTLIDSQIPTSYYMSVETQHIRGGPTFNFE